MPNCIKCNTYNNLGTLHCKNCAAILPVDSENNCPHCKTPNGPFAKVCRSCGYHLKMKNVIPLSNYKNEARQNRDGTTHIEYRCDVDAFTRETLAENYAILARELNVFPQVIVHQRGTYLPGGLHGYYDSENGSIEMVDTYYVISLLAHEMRHAYQHMHQPSFFYNTHITTASEYIASPIEKDARNYAIAYCRKRNYFEEVNALEGQEKEFNLFLEGQLTAAEVGLDETYYRTHPIYPQDVPMKEIPVSKQRVEKPVATYQKQASATKQNVPKVGFFTSLLWGIEDFFSELFNGCFMKILIAIILVMLFAALGVLALTLFEKGF